MKTNPCENSDCLSFVRRLSEHCIKFVNAVKHQNAPKIVQATSELLYFCESASKEASKCKSELDVSSNDCEIWRNTENNSHFSMGISCVSGLFLEEYAEEHIAEIYEWCMRISVALAEAQFEYVNDLIFEVIGEIYDHIYPMHLLALKDMGFIENEINWSISGAYELL